MFSMMTMLFVVWIHSVMGQTSTSTVVASESVCYVATGYTTDWIFNAPMNGNIVGVEMEYLSGGVKCGGSQLVNWGCGDRMDISLVRHNDDNSIDDVVYPTSDTNDLTSLSNWGCSRGCTVHSSRYSDVTAYSATADWIDEVNPVAVTTNDRFSLQYGEGCCGSSTSDNGGTACVKLSFVYSGASPTSNPSKSPTGAPTTSPSSSPSANPTMVPTRCDVDDMYNANWHNMMNENDDAASTLVKDYTVDFDASTLSLTVDATLEYVGKSADGNFDDAFNLGTTFWIDFQSFGSVDSGIDSPGSCGSRRSDSYDGLTFDQYWEYTADPLELDSVANAERMAYPPTDWTFSSPDCNTVRYQKTFSWTELRACTDADGNDLIPLTDSDSSYTLSGTFFVELVSPYSMASSGTGYFRTFPVIQQDFGIVMNRQVNVLASTGVQLFTTTVSGIGLQTTTDPDSGEQTSVLQLTVPVCCADYMLCFIEEVVRVEEPLENCVVTETSDECLVGASFTCCTINKIECDIDEDAEEQEIDVDNLPVNIGIICEEDNEKCATYLEDNGGFDTIQGPDGVSALLPLSPVVLEIITNIVIPCATCDTALFVVTFSADMQFFRDDAFSVAQNALSNPFVIGNDKIYVEVEVDFPSDAATGEIYDIFSTAVWNVMVCTAPESVDLAATLNHQDGTGGCLSDQIDGDGPYWVIDSGAENDYYEADIIAYAEAANKVRFSFLTFDTPRTTIYVHVQVTLSLTEAEAERRRLQDGEAASAGNQFRHFLATATVEEGEPETAGSEVESVMEGASSVQIAWLCLVLSAGSVLIV